MSNDTTRDTKAIRSRDIGDYMRQRFMRSAVERASAQLDSDVKGGPGSGNFGHSGRPGKVGGSAPRAGHGGTSNLREAGITSFRYDDNDFAGTDTNLVESQMHEFAGDLKKVATDVRVQFSRGGWKEQGEGEGVPDKPGGEPTWVTQYRTDNDAQVKSLLAQYGKRYRQDGVLVIKHDPGGDSPQLHMDFDRPIAQDEYEPIEKALVAGGIGGWTWYKRGDGNTSVMAQWVRDYAEYPAEEHEGKVSRAVSLLNSAGYKTGQLRKKMTHAEVMYKDDYDRFI